MTDERPHHPKPHAASSPSAPLSDRPADDNATVDGPEPLRLDHFLKISGVTESGGQAKLLIQGGEIKLNGEVETRRRRKLKLGDIVEFEGRKYAVESTSGAG